MAKRSGKKMKSGKKLGAINSPGGVDGVKLNHNETLLCG